MTWKTAIGPVLCFFGMASPAIADSLSEAYRAYEKAQFEEAAKGFKQHSLQKPLDLDQVYNAGVSLFKKGEFAEAANYFDRAKQSSDPKLKSKAAYNKGLAKAMEKRWDAAEAEFQEALSFDNDNQMIADNLAWAKEQKKQQKPEDQKQPPQDQNQQNADEKQSEEKNQKQAEDSKSQNSQQKDQEQSGAKDQQQAEEKSGEKGQQDQQKSAAKDQQQAQEKSGDKNQQQAEEKSAEKNQQTLQEKQQQASAQDDSKGKSPDGSGTPGLDSKNQTPQSITLKEMKQQEAEKLLRSVDDRIGTYILTPEQANMEGKSRNGKDW